MLITLACICFVGTWEGMRLLKGFTERMWLLSNQNWAPAVEGGGGGSHRAAAVLESSCTLLHTDANLHVFVRTPPSSNKPEAQTATRVSFDTLIGGAGGLKSSDCVCFPLRPEIHFHIHHSAGADRNHLLPHTDGAPPPCQLSPPARSVVGSHYFWTEGGPDVVIMSRTLICGGTCSAKEGKEERTGKVGRRRKRKEGEVTESKNPNFSFNSA